MDRPVAEATVRKRRFRLIAAAAAGGLTLTTSAVLLAPKPGARYVPLERVTIAEVTQGAFEDFAPLRLEVTPERSWRLDLAVGGQVAEVMARDGQRVRAGQPLVRLTNPTYELDAGARQTALIRDLASLQSEERALAQSLHDQRSALEDLVFEAQEAARDLRRQQRLHEQGMLSDAGLDDPQERARHAEARAERARQALEADAARIERQRASLRRTAALLEGQLARLRENGDALTITAPGAGLLTGFDPQVGASLAQGASVGRIDVEGAYKLTASVDEFHLARVAIGQKATANSASGAATLTVTQVRPQIDNGRFQIDLAFEGEAPPLKPGQTFDGRLVLAEPTPATLLPAGAFLRETGGSWAFVIEGDTRRAVRRTLEVGRRNPTTVEVLSGLEPGDRVVVSAYDDFNRAQRLILTGKGIAQ